MFFDCIFEWFKCKENVIADMQKEVDALDQVKKWRTGLKRQITNLTKQDDALKDELWDSQHYRFIYEDLPAPHEIKEEKPQSLRSKIADQLGERATQFYTEDSDKVTLSTSGVANWRIPRATFEKILHKYPLNLWDQVQGYSDNSVIRFLGNINISLYWNCCIYAVKTKTRWVAMFWPADEDDFLYADPDTKQMWKPDPSKNEDNPEIIIY